MSGGQRDTDIVFRRMRAPGILAIPGKITQTPSKHGPLPRYRLRQGSSSFHAAFRKELCTPAGRCGVLHSLAYQAICLTSTVCAIKSDQSGRKMALPWSSSSLDPKDIEIIPPRTRYCGHSNMTRHPEGSDPRVFLVPNLKPKRLQHCSRLLYRFQAVSFDLDRLEH